MEWLKMFGVNGGALAVTMTDVELMLKIILLALTCAWTVVKIVKLIKGNQ